MTDLLEQAREALGATYTIEREMHGGGMSRVFLAEERQFERKVVIKVLSPELAAGISAERFGREIKLAAQLQQANIVAVHAAGEIDGLPYYTMPFVEGESLRHRLARGPIQPTEGIAILKDVARALAYAHGKGVVHRDIKPENVLLSGDAAVVTDFGIAKAVSESKTDAPGGTLTVVGTSLGTPAYMAPEQAVGDTVDQRADIYAWGLMAYETLTGSHPFQGKHTAQQWITAQLTEKPAPLQQRRGGLSKGVAALVMRCLEKDPANRPETANEILRYLDDPTLMKSGHTSSTTRAAAQPSSARPSLRYPIAAGIGALIVIGGFFGARRFVSRPRPAGVDATFSPATSNTSKSINTVAVLPFTNTGGNAQDEYFSDGMTDELAHALSRVPTIRVASRTSSYAFKNKGASPQQIGKTLNVGGIVEGTVRRAGDRLRVTAQLSSASDGLVVWSDSYESKAKDVFALQDEFTKAIVTALTPALSGNASAVASSSRGTDNLAAYDLYLKGRYFWLKRGTTALLRSIDYFNEAIAKDPKFARAYAGLALAQVILPEYTTAVGDTMVERGIESANRAINLDSTVADGHFALGFASDYQMRFADSDAHFTKALALDPSNAIGRMWRAVNLMAQGKIDEAVSEMQKASQLDPLAPVVGGNLSFALTMAGKFDEARDVALKTLEIDSTSYTSTYDDLAEADVFNGRIPEALRLQLKSARINPEEPGIRGYLIFVYAAAGDWKNVKRLQSEILNSKDDASKGPDLLRVALVFGNKTEALTILERAFAKKSFYIYSPSPGCDPYLDILKNEPRYIALMHSAGMSICPVKGRWPIGNPPA